MAYSTPQKLVHAASDLFRQNGYAATGLSEILKRAGVPKGSLYHHFPGGKDDLAIAAAQLAGKHLRTLIEAAFKDVDDFNAGIETVCNAIADLFEKSGTWTSCPITTTLLDGKAKPDFIATADEIFASWRQVCFDNARRFGHSDAAANDISRTTLMLLHGSWIAARAENSAASIRQVPRLLDIQIRALTNQN
ncbi:TetR/AcrR family transcriptional regulator [Parasulfitobacter algicola]|uniref:TetR/AcrR family transcriptional regulator n=1 Tax=Parasulfitobacter algicola TaxID=2614809 RepID=A0ABX2IRI6_9RHOB|nr:TetR/AcrR family transcriptional regulator [Sulfitobacter algicola]NSX53407.1 TetR/AcrR family transcriptional regulator [Sulfitobacter algicola]